MGRHPLLALRSRALTLSLLVMSGAVFIVAGSQPWFRVAIATGGGTTLHANLRGPEAKSCVAIGLLLLASVPATFAVSSRRRSLYGGFLGVMATLPIWLILVRSAPATDAIPQAALVHVTRTPWPLLGYLAVIFGYLGALGVTLFGRTWSEMGRRYETGTKPVTTEDPWTAMERGIDPTEDQPAP